MTHDEIKTAKGLLFFLRMITVISFTNAKARINMRDKVSSREKPKREIVLLLSRLRISSAENTDVKIVVFIKTFFRERADKRDMYALPQYNKTD